MQRTQGVKQFLLSFQSDEMGNFGMMTAILLPILFGVAGASFELAKAMAMRSDLQTAADVATLSAATSARLSEGKKSDRDLTKEIERLITGQPFYQDLSEEDQLKVKNGIDAKASRTPIKNGNEFHLETKINFQMKLNPLLRFIGHDTLELNVASKSQSSYSSGTAMSLYLVLDRSGSMSFKTTEIDYSKPSCANYTDITWTQRFSKSFVSRPCYFNKIASLKTAVKNLSDTFNKSDPSYRPSNIQGSGDQSNIIRTAAIAYNETTFTGQPLDWGTSKSLSYVNNIPAYPEGGTNASGAMAKAFSDLKKSNPQEETAHKKAGNKNFQRFIVLMTDGEMTGVDPSWNPKIDDTVRKTCTAAKNDDIIIFTVAFLAPAKGQELLQFCATSPSHYYAPEKMDELVNAFGDIARKAVSVVSTLTN